MVSILSSNFSYYEVTYPAIFDQHFFIMKFHVMEQLPAHYVTDHVCLVLETIGQIPDSKAIRATLA